MQKNIKGIMRFSALFVLVLITVGEHSIDSIMGSKSLHLNHLSLIDLRLQIVGSNIILGDQKDKEKNYEETVI